MRVLVYEDNLFFIPALERRLEDLGHAGAVASRRDVASEVLASGVDAAIIDLNAPEAVAVAREARDSRAKVLAFCGHTQVALRREAKQAGFAVLLSNSNVVDSLGLALSMAETRR